MSSRKKGTYCIHICCSSSKETIVGRLGIIGFEPGHYLYMGSALRSLDMRIRRHRSDKKNVFWHIDYLTSDKDFSTAGAYIINSPERLECQKAGQLQEIIPSIPGFGSSDCSCRSHLFYAGNGKAGLRRVKEIMQTLGFKKW